MFITLKKKVFTFVGVLAIAIFKLRVTTHRTILIVGLAFSLAGLIGLLKLPNVSLQQGLWLPNLQKSVSPKTDEPVSQAALTDGQTDSSDTLLAPDAVTKTRVSETYGKLPLTFEVNQGQVDAQVKYVSRGSGYNLFLTGTEAVLALRAHGKADGDAPSDIGKESQETSVQQAVLRMKLLGASSASETKGLDSQPGKSNYFIGNDPQKWRTNVAQYARVQYTDVYPGVNLVYYGNQRQLEYDFVVAAGADPNVIRLAFTGADKLSVDEKGDLVLETGGGELRQHKPIVYQEVDGERKEVAGRYVLSGKQEVGFEVAEYDASQPLVIDPVLSYSTYLGGSSDESGKGIAVDSFGNAYVTGYTNSLNFPTVNSLPYRPSNTSDRFAFITKLSASGSWLVYSTYLGGNNGGSTESNSIAVDASGNAYITGQTSSNTFPTVNAFQSTGAVFVSKLNSTGSALTFSTHLGGTDANERGFGIAVDNTGNVYVVGDTRSSDFPIANALQPAISGNPYYGDAFITKFNPAGSALIYSTYLGGGSIDQANAVAVDSSGNAYVTGFTYSNDFPIANALQPTCGCSFGNCAGNNAVFISKLNPTGSAFVYSTFLGGNDTEEGRGIAVDSSGNAYITGSTRSTNFPMVNPFQATFNSENGSFCGGSTAFVSKLNSAGSALVYSTYLGGVGNGGSSIAVDSSGSAYITGNTRGGTLIFNPVQSIFGGGGDDAFVTKLKTTGSALDYYTYLGGSGYETARGIAIDSVGNAYVTGDTSSLNFPTTANSFQPVFGGGNPNLNVRDAFVSKIGSVGTPPGLSVSEITPDRGGNTGFVSATIYGNGFANNATVKLVRAGQPDIPATDVTISQNSAVARVRFNLAGQTPGIRDVVVTNPNNLSANLAGAFTVEAESSSQVWVDIVGRDEIRPGRPQTYYIFYGNRGNTDAHGVPLWIRGIPRDTQVELGFDISAPPPIAGQQPIDYSQIPAIIETDTEKVLPLYIPVIRAGESASLKIRLTVPSAGNFGLKAYALPAQYIPDTNQPANNPASAGRVLNCFNSILSTAINTAGIFVPTSCALGAASAATSGVQSIYAAANNNRPQANLSYTQFAIGIIGSCTPVSAQVTSAVNATLSAAQIPGNCGFGSGAGKLVRSVFSIDPNDKIGSLGVGTEHYISGEEPLRYSIYFENIASATAPAQDVVITDQLDASKLDFDTFSLGPISFGVDKIIIPPPGLSQFLRDVDLRPQNNLIVRIEAQLNKTTGLLTWRFTSLDPVTGLPTEDPNAGFLPPNITAPQGEGQVLFTVRPKENLATGTEIRNRALIVFDNNAPIITPEWLNTIDYSKPASQVLPLAATQSSNSFTVNWSGTDTGSGIASYTVFVSENGGPFNIWRQDTTATSGIFTGLTDTAYAFYSVARDKTGNQENVPATADATTRTLGPTAASVTVGGRVLDASRRAISRARVTLTDASGETRTALTNSFGYYRFDDVPAGETCVFSVSRKRYQFAPQILSVNEAVEDFDFVALP